MSSLATNSLKYVGLVWLISGPLGVILGWVLFRTDLWVRPFWVSFFIVAMFLPLPTYSVAWQGLLGETNSRWDQGILAAAWVQGMAALPWVTCLAGVAWKLVPREVEEESLTFVSPFKGILRISIRWVMPTFLMVILHIGVTSANEITITDLMIVRTFAEEVYTQHVSSDLNGLNRAVQVSLPACVLVTLALLWYARRWHGGVFARQSSIHQNYQFALGKWQTFVVTGVALVCVVFFGLPLFKIVSLAGGEGTPRGFSLAGFSKEMGQILRLHMGSFFASLGTSLILGVIATGIALGLCLTLGKNRVGRAVAFVGCGLLWSLPSPILGLGLKWTIELGMDVEEMLLATGGPIRLFFYDLPTPLPVIYAQMLKVFPLAMGYLWLVYRETPVALIEESHLLGFTPLQRFWHIERPRLQKPALLCVVLGAALSLAELSTSKMVQVPGQQTFIQTTFDQMHYGTTSTVAGLSLMPVVLGGVILPILLWFAKPPKVPQTR